MIDDQQLPGMGAVDQYFVRVRFAVDGRALVDVWAYPEPMLWEDTAGDHLAMSVLSPRALPDHMKSLGRVIVADRARGGSTRRP